MLRTIFTILTIIVITFILSTLTVVFGIFGPYSKIIYYIAKTWTNSILFSAGVKLKIEGLEKIDKSKSYIFIGNHQSHFDVLSVFSALPLTVRFMAKKELFNIPVFGWALYASGTIRIDRTNRSRAIESMNKALDRIKKGVSVVIFPEGTRSEDGKIREFKKGGFVLAIKGDIPIIPISISGSRFILRKHSNRINAGDIKIVISDPIHTKDYGYGGRKKLNDYVRNIIIKNYDEHYNEGSK
jgi:1-acyl-sn-glycerol-3-phosphate acyltransferase